MEGRARVRRLEYKWVALTNTTLGMLMATINASILLIALPDIFRGIHIDPLAPGNTSYLLWLILSFLVVMAVLLVSLGRLGDIYGRVRMFNLGFAVFTVFSILLSINLDARQRRGALADPDAGRTGCRRRADLCELERDPDRRLPAGPAGARPRREQHRRDRRLVPRARSRRRARADLLAARVPRLGPDRSRRDVLGLPLAARAQRAPAGADRLVGQRDLCDRVGRRDGRDHVRDPALRWSHDGVDVAARARLPARRPRFARCLLPDRVARRGTDVPSRPLPYPRLRGSQSGRAAGGDGARRTAVHPDHLAAGDLAARARLQLRPDAALGGHLHAAAGRRLSRRRPSLRLPF